MNKFDVGIIGAGIAGLTAAYHCAKNGYDVVVYERDKQVGFPVDVVFTTALLNIESLEKTIGINLKKIFQPIEECSIIVYNSKVSIKKENLFKMYNVKRGDTKDSIDNYLLKKALNHGVNFEFNKDIKDPSKINAKKIIVACGHESTLFRQLDIKCRPGYCIFGSSVCDDEPTSYVIINDRLVRGGYAHIASFNKTKSVLIGSLEKQHSVKDWNRLIDFLIRKKIIHHRINPIYSSNGWLSTKMQLYSKMGYILAGAISGCNDPFTNFGLVHSLVSGKIASLAIDQDGSEIFNKTYSYNRVLDNLLIILNVLRKVPYHERLFELLSNHVVDFNYFSKLCNPYIK